MSYTPRYQVELPANPTIPGMTTTIAQEWDASLLTDRYIKQMTNALRRYGTLPRWGGMYQTVAMAAKHLGTQPCIGFYVRDWCGAGVQADGGRELDKKYKPYFKDLIKLSEVRHKMQLASGAIHNPWGHETDRQCEWGEYGVTFVGWRKTQAKPSEFRDELTKVFDKIPNYRADMNRIADWLETRPKITLTHSHPMRVVDRKPGGTSKLAP